MTKSSTDLAKSDRELALWAGNLGYAQAVERLDTGAGLHALEGVATAQTGLEVLTHQAVTLARSQGATWQQVADALGLGSKQTAQQRYGST